MGTVHLLHPEMSDRCRKALGTIIMLTSEISLLRNRFGPDYSAHHTWVENTLRSRDACLANARSALAHQDEKEAYRYMNRARSEMFSVTRELQRLLVLVGSTGT